jgi:hypothetical protein
MSQLSNLVKISFGVLLLTSIPQRVNAQSAAVFKDSTGAIFLYGLQPNSSVEVGTVGNLVKAIRVAIPSGIASNNCGLVLVNSAATFTIEGQTVNPASITDVRRLSNDCGKMSNYPSTFKTPDGARSGTKLIISSIPPGTYTVANAANLALKNTYTVTSKACLVAERSLFGNATNFLVSRQGLTLPISWGTLPEIPAIKVPSC